MADQRNGGIAWTEETWNPLRGCSRVSQGCVNCYAESMAARFCGAGQPYEGTINPETKRWNGNIKLVHDKLQDPLRWQRPRMVFVNSMSDLFHEDVPDDFIDRVFAVMALAEQHTFQVLTKRPERMRDYMLGLKGREIDIGYASVRRNDGRYYTDPDPIFDNAVNAAKEGFKNVWLGTTVENQQSADERIPLLINTPAAVRWLSCEPLLGKVDLFKYIDQHVVIPALLDWVVVGGESGPNARPLQPDWARSLRDQCEVAGVPFLFKQWGEWLPDNQNPAVSAPHDQNGAIRVGKKAAGRLLDGVQHDGYPETNP